MLRHAGDAGPASAAGSGRAGKRRRGLALADGDDAQVAVSGPAERPARSRRADSLPAQADSITRYAPAAAPSRGSKREPLFTLPLSIHTSTTLIHLLLPLIHFLLPLIHLLGFQVPAPRWPHQEVAADSQYNLRAGSPTLEMYFCAKV